MKELLRRLGYLLRGSRFHEELDEEIEFHIETRADEIEQSGVSRSEALAQARREFGHTTRLREETRSAWSIRWLEDLISDLHYAVRAFRGSPGFTAVAVLSLALGIGANTAIFSLVDTVMLRALPVKDPEQLQLLRWRGDWKPESLWGSYVPASGGESTSDSFSSSVFQELKARNRSFSELFAVSSAALNAILNGHAFPVWGELVSGGYFPGLGVSAMLGRTLTPEDDTEPGTSPVVVISHRFWREHFHGSVSAVGANITLNRTPYTVVGVMGPDFHGLDTVGGFGLWLPMSMEEQAIPSVRLLSDPNTWWVRIVGRLKPGVPAPQAQAELDTILRQTVANQGLLRARRPTTPRMEMSSASKGRAELRNQYGDALTILMIVVGLVLLIACANLANLLLSRATARSREIGVRLALGASRGRLIRQLLTESLLLSCTGALLGLVFARWTLIVLPPMVTGGWEPSGMEFSLDARVLGFALLVSVSTAIAFGWAPAMRATRVQVNPLLKGVIAGSPKRSNPGRALVVFQVALSLFLLIGAGLFARTLIGLRTLETGFRSENVLLFGLEPTLSGYDEGRLRDYYDTLKRNIEGIPGVASVTLSEVAPISGRVSQTNFSIEGRAPADRSGIDMTYVQRVAPRYFETMQIPILAGRAIGEEDRAASPKVAVISENIVRKFFAGRNPIGQRMGFGGPRSAREMEIVGVAKDAKYRDMRAPAPPTVYVPFRQHGLPSATVALRASVAPKSLIPAVRRVVESMDHTIPVSDFRTQEEQIDQSLRQERLFAKLCGFFSLTALLLTAIGVYGALSYAVARRTKEIGIRMAIGAGRRNVIWLVMRESIALTLAGVAIGIAAALATSDLLTKMLFGLQPNDPPTIVVAALFLVAVAGFAAYLPGRRASRVDPLQALRHE